MLAKLAGGGAAQAEELRQSAERLIGSGDPLVVMMAALPVGSNALIFAQRYGALEAETTAAIVFSTFAFVATAPLWLAVLGYVNR